MTGSSPSQTQRVVRRGEVYEARFGPGTEGSEQAGQRPAVIVSHDAINTSSSVIIVVPCKTYRGRHIYSSQVLLRAPDGGLTADSVALGEQVRALSKTRLLYRRGALSSEALTRLDRALLVALDLHQRA